jgi:hypothetical protein
MIFSVLLNIPDYNLIPIFPLKLVDLFENKITQYSYAIGQIVLASFHDHSANDEITA